MNLEHHLRDIITADFLLEVERGVETEEAVIHSLRKGMKATWDIQLQEIAKAIVKRLLWSAWRLSKVASHFLLGVEICTGKDGSLDYCISVCIVRYDCHACCAKVAFEGSKSAALRLR